MNMTDAEFEKLVGDYSSSISRAIQRVCYPRQTNSVEDIRQEVHIKLLGLVRSGKKMEHPESYIFRVAYTTALRYVQSKGDWVSLDSHHMASSSSDHEELSQRKMLIQSLLLRLKKESRQALKAYLAGFNHKDIASLFGWSESKARHLVYRSMEKLRAMQHISEN